MFYKIVGVTPNTVAAFVERYNAEWRVEKVGFKSPSEAREDHALRAAG